MSIGHLQYKKTLLVHLVLSVWESQLFHTNDQLKLQKDLKIHMSKLMGSREGVNTRGFTVRGCIPVVNFCYKGLQENTNLNSKTSTFVLMFYMCTPTRGGGRL